MIQLGPRVIVDGNGGAIIEWQNDALAATNAQPPAYPYEEYTHDYSAQKLDENGTPVWGSHGSVLQIVFSTYNPSSWNFNYKRPLGLVTDGKGGAIFLLYEYWWMSSNSYDDIILGRIDMSGHLVWSRLTVTFGHYPYSTSDGRIVPDGRGGALVSWMYPYGARDVTRYPFIQAGAACIDSSGNTLWKAFPLGNGGNTTAWDYSLAPDGTGGAYVAWTAASYDGTNIGDNWNLYGQHIDESGVQRWGANGMVICDVPGGRNRPWFSGKLNGGAVVAWRDYRHGTFPELFAARVRDDGALPWTPGGVSVYNGQISPGNDSLVSICGVTGDSKGRTWVVWNKGHAAAQLLDSMGSELLPPNGARVGSDAAIQSGFYVASNSCGEPFLAWQDYRNSTDYDIYGQWLSTAIPRQLGSVGVVVNNIPGYGDAGSGVNVSLYDANARFIQALDADAMGRTLFSRIALDTGYSIAIRCKSSDSSKVYGNEYWGSLGGIAVTGAGETEISFNRNAPYTSDIKVYDENRNEPVSGVVPLGTPVKVAIEITNPNEPGSAQQSAQCLITLDHDKQAGFDFRDSSATRVMAVGTKDTFWFAVPPLDSGDYFHVAGARILQNGKLILTEGGAWGTLPTFIVGPPPPGEVKITVQTSPSGCSYVVDDSTYTGTKWFVWPSGSVHRLSAPQTQTLMPGMRLTWNKWSDGDSVSHALTIPAVSTVYTATFDTSYYLTLNAGNGGVVQPANAWYKSGATVQITAHPNAGWKLSQWTGVGKGSYSGTDTTASVMTDSVITETAAFERTTGVSDLKLGIPSTFVLNGNYPNPFNPTTTIRFGVPTKSLVRITVYNILGALVARLVEEEVSAGYHEVRFDATKIASGMYLYRMQAGAFVETRKLILVR